MTKRHNQEGFVLTTAVIILVIMVTLSLATYAIINVQTSQTGYERAGEAAFNLAESALQAEAYQLRLAWPSKASQALPVCNQSSAQTVGCEGVALTNNLSSSYVGPEYAGATWSAQVLDDPASLGGANYYSNALLTSSPATPSWDANGDGRVWVRAQATVGAQTRTLVEQMVHQTSVLTVPDNTVTAGGVYSENLGNKVMIQAYDSSSGLTGPVEVRCGDSSTQPTYGSGNCLGWSAGKGQLSPPGSYGAGYQDPGGGYQTLTNDQINMLVATAQQNGTYYPTPSGTQCPPEGTAGIVVIADGSACPVYNGTATWNTAANPGALIVLKGPLTLSGNETFYGVVYMANQSGDIPPCTSEDLKAPPILTVDGNAAVYGAVFVDRCGVVAVGESGSPSGPGNISFGANGLNGLYAADAAAPAQNTFRIVSNN